MSAWRGRLPQKVKNQTVCETKELSVRLFAFICFYCFFFFSSLFFFFVKLVLTRRSELRNNIHFGFKLRVSLYVDVVRMNPESWIRSVILVQEYISLYVIDTSWEQFCFQKAI